MYKIVFKSYTRINTHMVPFIETIKTKEGLIEACKKGFEDYQE